MKHQFSTAAKALIAATLLLFTGLANAQSTGTQTLVFAEPGSTDTLTTYARSQGREFSIDIVYDDTVTDRSVVAFNVHWDDSEVTFGGIENLKPIADSDSAACQVGGSQPTAVGTAGNNTKVGGPSLTIGSDAGVAEGDDDDGESDTDQKATAVWAQICGDVFTEDDAIRVATAKFTWKEASTATSTKIGLSQAHGGDFGASTFDGTSVEILPQTFSLDVDGNGSANADDVSLIFRYLLLGGDAIPNALLETGIGSAAGKGAEIKVAISAGSSLLDVDANGSANADDISLIFRYLLLGGSAIPNALLEQGIGSAAGKGDAIKAAIQALI